MAIHSPVIRQIHVPAVPNPWAVVLAVALFAVLVAAMFLIQPTAKPAEFGAWTMTEQRHGEIDAGRSGPHPDVLLFRAGEINAANE